MTIRTFISQDVIRVFDYIYNDMFVLKEESCQQLPEFFEI
jgi:hypothetical protein